MSLLQAINFDPFHALSKAKNKPIGLVPKRYAPFLGKALD